MENQIQSILPRQEANGISPKNNESSYDDDGNNEERYLKKKGEKPNNKTIGICHLLWYDTYIKGSTFICMCYKNKKKVAKRENMKGGATNNNIDNKY